jgi:two-component system response regulator NreC
VIGSPGLVEVSRLLAAPTVLLLDEHPVVRAGLRMLLERDGLRIVAEASSLTEASRLDDALDGVDVVVTDLRLKDARGPEVVAALRRAMPAAGVLVLTMTDDPDEVVEALRSGARGYLLKEAAPADLVDAVRRVAAGETYLQPSLGAALVSRGAAPAAGAAAETLTTRPPRALTPREVEVLGLLARGHTNAEMSALLAMSLRTVEAHRARLLRKLGFGTRAELVRYAAELGLLQFDGH